jgi:hypothetical protein
MAERNQGVGEDRRITFRIGVNLGDIIIDGDDTLRRTVSLAVCFIAMVNTILPSRSSKRDFV